MLNINIITGGRLETNSYIIEESQNTLIIDYNPQVYQFVRDNKLQVEYLLLTHIHFDHIELLSLFQKEYSFKLLLSEFALENINNPEFNLLKFIPKEEWQGLPPIDITNANSVKDDDKILWNNKTIEVMQSPGHSPGSLIYILREKEWVFSGDTLFYGSVGVTDLPGSSKKSMIASIQKLFLNVPDNFIVYPGHGSKTTIQFEKEHNIFLQDLSQSD